MGNEHIDVSMRQTFSIPLVLTMLGMAGSVAAVYANQVATDRELQTRLHAQSQVIETLQADNRAIKSDLRADLREIKDELRELRNEVNGQRRK